MADGISVQSDLENLGFSDKDLTTNFLDGTVKGVLLDFAQKFQKDLQNSIDRNGLNYTSELFQSLTVNPDIVELDGTIIYTLTYPIHGAFQDEGVNGVNNNVGSEFSFKTLSTGGIRQALETWGQRKFGLQVDDAKRFGYLAARKKKIFGIKPTYWLRDIINDGRMEQLEQDLGKQIGLVLVGKSK